MIPIVDLTENEPIEGDADQQRTDRGGDQRPNHGAHADRGESSSMRSHHEQGAMCQIDDVEDPEDKGQARGDQK